MSVRNRGGKKIHFAVRPFTDSLRVRHILNLSSKGHLPFMLFTYGTSHYNLTWVPQANSQDHGQSHFETHSE
jgi:hypothetical protein